MRIEVCYSVLDKYQMLINGGFDIPSHFRSGFNIALLHTRNNLLHIVSCSVSHH